MKNIISILLLLFCFSFQYAKQIGDTLAANKVINNVLGTQSDRFILTLEKDNSEDWFEINVSDNKIHIIGNSQIALCKGAYHYITDNGYGLLTWEGNKVEIPSEVADKKYERISSNIPLRMYVNPVTYGYTTVWWDWERWEKEIDWMAMHGINMPIALLGQEYIWQKVWQDIGIGKEHLNDYYCGPAFLPWFRMGNIYNHNGPLPESWIEQERQLQKKILAKMQSLEMKPVTPAFSGHVPPYFKEVYPNSKTYTLKNWSGFEDEKASILLDPKDSLFQVIGKKFLAEYEKEYGKTNYYLADSFNEMFPPVSEENKNEELAEYGAAIFKGIKEHNETANWVVQGWTFGHQKEFWTSESTKSFFSKIPKDNLLILNYGEDQYPIWDKLDAFYGFKWTYGYVHNYGGQQSMFGDLKFYHDGYKELLSNPNKKNLVGYGCLPEALENNSIVYECIFDMPWNGINIELKDWMHQYLTNRYGKVTPNVLKAWDIALNNTYSVRVWKFQSIGLGTYIHNNRPSLSINEEMLQGNVETVADVLKLLLDDLDKYKDEELYIYDVIDFAQHYAAYLVDVSLIQAVQHFHNKEYKKMTVEFEKTKEYFKTLEQLQVATGGSLAKWCEDAISKGTTAEEKQLYLQNAKSQITIWGGQSLKDYASKSWAGMISDFYIPRWEHFFKEMSQHKAAFKEVPTVDNIKKWENEWCNNPYIPQDLKKLSNQQYIALISTLFKE